MGAASRAVFACAACDRKYTWKKELAGKTVRCKCGVGVRVPAMAPSVEVGDAMALLNDLAEQEKQASGTGPVRVYDPPKVKRMVAAPRARGSGLPKMPGIRLASRWWKRGFKHWAALFVCVVLGPIVMVVGVGNYNKASTFDAKAKVATGVIAPPVTKRQEERHRKYGTYTVDIYEFKVVFEAAGARQEAMIEHLDEDLPSSYDRNDLEGWKGSGVEVRYDPDRPSDADIQKRTNSKAYLGLGFGLFGILMVLGGLVGVVRTLFTSPEADGEE